MSSLLSLLSSNRAASVRRPSLPPGRIRTRSQQIGPAGVACGHPGTHRSRRPAPHSTEEE